MVLAAFLQWPHHEQVQPCDSPAWRTLAETHLTRYPEMEVQDLYKLLHQGVFGSGHAVPDRRAAAEWLRREIAGLEAEPPAAESGSAAAAGPAEAPLNEAVAPGSAIVRVHLRPFLAAGGDPEALLDAFVATANRPRGDAAAFRCAAEAAGAAGATAGRWADGAWTSYVEARTAEGLPAVHHSAPYAAAYRPAYRVVEGGLVQELLQNSGVRPVRNVMFERLVAFPANAMDCDGIPRRPDRGPMDHRDEVRRRFVGGHRRAGAAAAAARHHHGVSVERLSS